MSSIFAFIVCGVFLFGLLQWARSGDGIWRISSLQRGLQRDGKTLSWKEREKAEKEIRQLESRTDSMLRASFRALAVVALCAWVVVGLTFLLDAFGVNWVNRLTTRATQYWRAAVPSNSFENRGNAVRNDMLRGMSLNMK